MADSTSPGTRLYPTGRKSPAGGGPSRRPYSAAPQQSSPLDSLTGKRPWEAEPRENTGVEVRQRTDPVAGQREDVEAGAVPDAAVRSTDIDAERELTVGPRRHEVTKPALPADGGEEAGHGVAAL